jgi:hypothetical protein
MRSPVLFATHQLISADAGLGLQGRSSGRLGAEVSLVGVDEGLLEGAALINPHGVGDDHLVLLRIREADQQVRVCGAR